MGGTRKSCRGERKAGRRRGTESRWLLGGRLVVVLASCAGAVFGVGMVVAEGHGGERGKKRLAEERDVHGGLLQTQWWLAGGLGNAWWCWLLKAELEEEMVMVLVSCGGGRKKKKQKKKICSGEREEGWFFGLLWTRFSPPSGHEIHLYL
jgi:hypothetical protein